jgi:hypothetical protein
MPPSKTSESLVSPPRNKGLPSPQLTPRWRRLNYGEVALKDADPLASTVGILYDIDSSVNTRHIRKLATQ